MLRQTVDTVARKLVKTYAELHPWFQHNEFGSVVIKVPTFSNTSKEPSEVQKSTNGPLKQSLDYSTNSTIIQTEVDIKGTYPEGFPPEDLEELSKKRHK